MIKCLTIIEIELEFGNVGFEERGKTEYREKNLSEQGGDGTNNKLNPHMTPGLGIEPGTHWWEAHVIMRPANSSWKMETLGWNTNM